MPSPLSLPRLFFALMLLGAGAQAFQNPSLQHMQQMQMMNSYGYHQTKTKYDITAWPKGEKDPISFRSAFYEKDGRSFVHLDDTRFLFKDDSLIRYAADFDSLKSTVLAAKRTAPAGPGNEGVLRGGYDTATYKAVTDDDKWVFPMVSGRISLYTNEPGSDLYSRMNLGAGLVDYSEKDVRHALAANPAANAHLRRERNARIAEWSLFIGGAGLAIVGFFTSIETKEDPDGSRYKQPSPGPLFFLGIGTMLGAWVPYFMADGQYEAAIRVYNEAAD